MASMDSKWVQAKETAQRVLGFTNVKVDKDEDYPFQGHYSIILYLGEYSLYLLRSICLQQTRNYVS